MADRPPLPPFDAETAAAKVQAAEDAWNSQDPERVSLAYTEDAQWRNRDQFVTGRAEIVAFLTAKWEREQDYALRKSLWAYTGDRIAVRFAYECRDATGQWWRSHGNENWEFDAHGLTPPRGEHQRPSDRRGRPADLRTAVRGRARHRATAALIDRPRSARTRIARSGVS